MYDIIHIVMLATFFSYVLVIQVCRNLMKRVLMSVRLRFNINLQFEFFSRLLDQECHRIIQVQLRLLSRILRASALRSLKH